MSGLPERPICVLIAAMGGEGGGGLDPLGSEGGRLLLKWMTTAAATRGFPAQSTLMPGTTQRTGSTTYYFELYPVVRSELAGRQPVFRTSPRPGDVDLIAAYELLEGARLLQAGFAAPELTNFVASTHRAHSIVEKIATRDGRFDSRVAVEAANECCKDAVMFDMSPIVRRSGGSQNGAMLGAIAATGVLPLTREDFSAAIGLVGADVEPNRSAFDLAFDIATQAADTAPEKPRAPDLRRAAPFADAEVRYPASALPILREGYHRAHEFQDKAYAQLYLKRLDAVLALDERGQGREEDFKLTRECGRYLATWMAYEDVIRVADLKVRRERFERVRREVGAQDAATVRVTEYLKPGLEELCSLLPSWLARRILAAAAKRGLTERLSIGLHVKSTNVTGFMLLRIMSMARVMRRRGYRYQEENRLIEKWLDAVSRAESKNHDLALEIVECARLIKGYSNTRRRAVATLQSILDRLAEPALQSEGDLYTVANQVRCVREAAFADPEGSGFDDALEGIVSGYGTAHHVGSEL